MTIRPQSKPSDVSAEAGEVLLDGPDGVVLSFTPDAAEETSRRLHDASVAAREQSGPEQDEEAASGRAEGRPERPE